jgi:hypothetical protein
LLVAGAIGAALVDVDLPAAVSNEFWSDGATYYTAALSVAFDGDLEYEARDVLRVRRQWGSGPEGIFLKRASGGLRLTKSFPFLARVPASEPRIYFAKALLYPVLAAPFVRVLGADGLLAFNGICLGVVLVLGFFELRRARPEWTAFALTLSLVLVGTTPVYAVWLQPELLNLALVAAALFAWSRERVSLSAVLVGLATYSKPSNILLGLPLLALPLLVGAGDLRRRLLEALRRGLVLGGTTAALFSLNAAVTGELNYQGGERKTFYRHFPFEDYGVSFGNAGIWMTTEHVGPRLSGVNDQGARRGEGASLAREELEQAFVANLGYFWGGRFAGAAAYFFPFVLALLAFLAWGPRTAQGWLAVAAFATSYIFYVWLIPANWFGGAGALGNRYFPSLVPLAFYFVPRRGGLWLAGIGCAVGLVFVGPILREPLQSTLQPWRHSLLPQFQRLPLERTMLNDLPIFLETWRKKQPVGDAEGDPASGRAGDPDSYWLYFPNDGSRGKQEAYGREGFWVRPGASAEVVVRAQEPVREMSVAAFAAEAGVALRVRGAAIDARASLRKDEPVELLLRPGAGVINYDSFVYVLRFEAEGGDPGSGRAAFVSLALRVAPRPTRPNP